MSKHQAVAPLTIIAIFAGIIESSALATLPFLSDDSQSFYTWFLVGFPFFLTALFFLTLNFNNRAFYRPDKNTLKDNFEHSLRDTAPLPEYDTGRDHADKPVTLVLSGPEAKLLIKQHVLKVVTQTPIKGGTWIYCNLDEQQSFRLSIRALPHNAAALME
ncbi:hypothetical protein ACIQUF_21480 [Pseudomonas sp. NPDC090233]|uniref:hypothetical protein n=1 Tax=Pseudomonas sp. NPDC090233 TaxID=3364479 RepID=UPI00383A78EC